VQLRPGAAVEGRLVDPDGRPRPDVELVIWRDHKETAQPGDFVYFPRRHKTDQQGRFRIDGLLPGYEFAVSDGKGYRSLGGGLTWDQMKDLGDVKIGDE
jgi:protocatechuate 3,4-dioxygenase beta subunit